MLWCGDEENCLETAERRWAASLVVAAEEEEVAEWRTLVGSVAEDEEEGRRDFIYRPDVEGADEGEISYATG